MKTKNINIADFLKKFNQEYNFPYNARSYVAGYDEAVQAFDDFLGSNKKLVADFASFRKDFISSDREAAAFMFALDYFENNQ